MSITSHATRSLAVLILIASGLCSADTLSGSFRCGGLDRSYILAVPARYSPQTPVPLIVAMHAYGQNPVMMMEQDKFSKIADTANFLVVYPRGYKNGWNAGICCGDPTEVHEDIDDVQFIRALVDTLKKRYAIDANRIYASGYSNGSMMAHRLACEASDIFAAVGGSSGGLALVDNSACTPGRPVSICNFHALNDPTVGYFAWKGDTVGVPIPEVMTAWARSNQCDVGPDSSRYNQDATVKRWSRGNSPIEVILYSTASTAHSWPSTVPTSQILWDFFRRHSLTDGTLPAKTKATVKKK